MVKCWSIRVEGRGRQERGVGSIGAFVMLNCPDITLDPNNLHPFTVSELAGNVN